MNDIHEDATSSEREPIAIVGIGCRFPGGASDPGAFWKMLCDGVDAVGEVPPDRWNIESFFHPEPDKPGKTNSRWGGFIEGIDRFDAGFFGISPREANFMDPQQRLLLEVAFEAMEDGGQSLQRWTGKDVAVFMGLSSFDYSTMQTDFRDRGYVDVYTNTGTAFSIVANRVSYSFDFRGPSATVDTACSSSLVAVHLACQSLWRRESPLALAGGVNVLICPDGFIGFSKLAMMSPDGRCRAFDARANGFVRGEGAGVVVLKPLSQARLDGDRIYAVIRGTAVNQDGHTNGMTVPSQTAQEALIVKACQEAGIEPAQVQYVEAHGTGTPVGDPIEARALGAALATGRAVDQPCLIGSVKTNIGHLEPAAGIAGLIKTALALHHREIPPSLHFAAPPASIPLAELRLRVASNGQPWPDDGPALAGVNSFCFGGTNAHVILQGLEASDYRFETADCRLTESFDQSAISIPVLVPLSARSPEALQQLATSYKELIAEGNVSMSDLAYTAGVRRTHHDHRLAVAASSAEEFAQELGVFLAGETSGRHACNRVVSDQERKLAFVFCGQGPQWWAMGRELLSQEPVFRDMVERCDELLRKEVGWSILRELMAEESGSRMDETAVAQPALFTIQVALAELWRSWGIEPSAVVGHSVGEVAAAYTAGALSLEDAIRVIAHRGRCMELAPAQGGMLAVGMGLEEARSVLNGFNETVAVAAINGPASLTLTGPTAALEEIARSLESREVFHRQVRVNYAFHSPGLEPIRDELERSLDSIRPGAAALPMYSTVTGQRVDGCDLTPEYWWRNLREPVRFLDAVNQLIDAKYRVIVEIGPHPVLASSVVECYSKQSQKVTVLPSLRRHEGEGSIIRRSLGSLYTLGHPINWGRVNPVGRFVPLPTYPWQRQRYWQEQEELRQRRIGRPENRLLGQSLSTPEPTWETRLDSQLLPWLNDHRVKGRMVFPGVGYLELALAAARASQPESSHLLEDVKFVRACMIPDNKVIVAQTVIHPEDNTFSIHGRRQGAQGNWTLHARGVVRATPSSTAATAVKLTEIWDRCPVEMPREECYQLFRERGLEYGPTFRGIDQMWRGDGECLARIEIPESIRGATWARPLHPATVDACLHVVVGAIAGAENTNSGGPNVYLPVEISEVRVHRWSGETLWSHGRLVEKGRGYVVADVRVFEETGQVVWEALGLRCQAVAGAAKEAKDSGNDLLYEAKWRLSPRATGSNSRRDAADLPSPEKLAQNVQAKTQQWLTEQNLQRRKSRFEADSGRVSAAFAWSALRKLGADFQLGQRFTLESLAAQLRIIPRHQRLLGRFLDWLAEDGILAKASDAWECVKPASDDPEVLWRELLHRHPSFAAESLLVERCGRNLAEVLRGNVEPLHIIFPEASLGAAEHLYQDSEVWRFYNRVVQDSVCRLVDQLPQGKSIRILEVGGGTGATASYLLPILPAEQTEYVFTDLSGHFLAHAEQKFRDYPFVHYQKLDIERDPTEQGFEEQSFDIVIATQVLHGTANLRESLEHMRHLLASSGWLLLLEFVRPVRWLELVFGTLEGWWRHADFDVRPENPILDWPGWQRLLNDTGFRDAVDLSATNASLGNVVMAARAPQTEWGVAEPAVTTSEPAGSWLLFADRGGVAEKLAQRLEKHGQRCIRVHAGARFQRRDDCTFELSPASRDDMESLLAELKSQAMLPLTIVHLSSLDGPAPDALTAEVLEDSQRAAGLSALNVLQASMRVLDEAVRLVLVTRRAQAVSQDEKVSPEATMLWGLGRVITNETPRFRCRRMDLGGADLDAEIQGLLEEVLNDSGEDELAFRGRGRYVPRHGRCVPEESAAAVSPSPEKHSFRLDVAPSATLDGLTLRLTPRRAPGAGEVEIEVIAAGLNFSDVMKALGLYPGLADGPVPLGLECSGKISAVSKGVADFHVGDEVLAVAPFSFGKHVVASAHLVARKPEHLSFEEAATIPVAFLTASHALLHQGRMEAGERVLIHSATGGVGLAALQLARAAGAEIFATAGTPEKRDLLRALGIKHVMDSRTLSFADEILKSTNGRGVDVILNSLAGEAIPKGLSALAQHGRFLEIGKSDIYKNNKLGLFAFRKNISLIAVDMVAAMSEKPGLVAAEFQRVIDRVREGELTALPHRVFSLDRIGEAFRFMSQGKHIGKVVLSFRDQPRKLAPPLERPPIVRADATYLITGGLGGFGLASAKWLVEQGARYLVLMSRSGGGSPEAQQAVAGLQEAGAQVLVAQGDVTVRDDIERTLSQVRSSMPPLRGVIHAAMVLDDCLLENLSPEQWLRVMRPKATGAWNLHSLTKDLPLDFFVCYSSMATVFGTPGQANYSAANAFLDGLAHYRHACGLPALTVNWGYIGDAGYVARNEKLGKRLESWGARRFSSKQGLAQLARLLQNHAVHASIMGLDWNRFRPLGGRMEDIPARFRDLCTSAQGQKEQKICQDVPLRARLLEADLPERGKLLESALRDKVARALGASPSKLDVTQPIAGIDSLVGVELRNWIEEELRVNIPVVRLTQGPSVAELRDMILQQLPVRVS